MSKTPTNTATTNDSTTNDSAPIRIQVVASERHLGTAWQQLAAGQPLELVAAWTPADGEGHPIPPRRYLRRLAVQQHHGTIRYLKVEDIDWIAAERQYLRLHTNDGSVLARGESMTVKDLAGRLDPDRFMRVHRSYVVNLDRIEALRVEESGKRYAVLASGHDVPVSRASWEALQGVLTG
jgi:DNA-binding LytR/AlgR family response regulator